MRESLLEVQERVPFNNFSSLLESDGVEVPASLGGDCVVQAKILVRDLRAKGREARYLKGVNSRHVAVIAREPCGDTEREFYLDPFLFQDEPLSLCDAFGEKAVSVVGARPVVEGRPTEIVARGMDHGAFSVAVRAYDGAATSGVRYVWEALYALGNVTEELLLADGQPSWLPPSTFTLRVSDGQGGILNIKRGAYSKREFSVGRLGHHDRIVTSVDEMCPEAEAAVAQIAALVKMDAAAMMEKLAQASKISIKRSGGRVEGVY